MSSLVEPAAAFQVFDQHNNGLRVEFFRIGANYTHRIVGVGVDGTATTLLESVECGPSPLRGEVRRGVAIKENGCL